MPQNDFLTDALKLFKDYQRLGGKALERMTEEQLHWEPAAGSNTAAVIVQHLSGNMRSRFTDFLNSDGEKPDRNRDAEFEANASQSKEEILALWEMGWNVVFKAIEPLTESHLQQAVFIRGEAHTVQKAILRQIAHYAYHIGQLVYLSKMVVGESWESLSIPRGASQQFNQSMSDKNKTT